MAAVADVVVAVVVVAAAVVAVVAFDLFMLIMKVQQLHDQNQYLTLREEHSLPVLFILRLR